MFINGSGRSGVKRRLAALGSRDGLNRHLQFGQAFRGIAAAQHTIGIVEPCCRPDRRSHTNQSHTEYIDLPISSRYVSLCIHPFT
jgi:hypothetical protein